MTISANFQSKFACGSLLKPNPVLSGERSIFSTYGTLHFTIRNDNSERVCVCLCVCMSDFVSVFTWAFRYSRGENKFLGNALYHARGKASHEPISLDDKHGQSVQPFSGIVFRNFGTKLLQRVDHRPPNTRNNSDYKRPIF